MSDPAPIVVLEDERAIAALIPRVLEAAGVINPVACFPDGDATEAYLRDSAVAAAPVPALALLDLHVGGRGGLEILQFIRATPALAGMPVIILSGSADDQDVDRATALGATAFLIKPLGLVNLAGELQTLGLWDRLHHDDEP